MPRTNQHQKRPAREALASGNGSVTRELQYIADSPEQKYGGFHIHAVTTAKNALKEIRRLRRAVKWALGESGDFAQRKAGQGAYWWRTELRRRAGMSPNGPAEQSAREESKP